MVDLLDIENIVFSRIKNKYPADMKTKYPNTTFTTDDKKIVNPKFPAVYIHQMTTEERGQDLIGESINAVLSTFQIDVYDNSSQENAKKVMNYVVAEMKAMAFTVISLPEFKNTNSIYRETARFRRMIGSGDTL